MKHARVVANKVVETFEVPIDKEIFEFFTPDIAGQFIPCGDEVEANWEYVDGDLIAPVYEEIIDAVIIEEEA
jgi:hypothetical protein